MIYVNSNVEKGSLVTINELVKDAHETAKSKGWWEEKRATGEIHMLIVSEVAEATEAARDGSEEDEKEELADAVIRIMDYFGYKGWDLGAVLDYKMKINKSRLYRHGGKLF